MLIVLDPCRRCGGLVVHHGGEPCCLRCGWAGPTRPGNGTTPEVIPARYAMKPDGTDPDLYAQEQKRKRRLRRREAAS